MTSSNCVYWIRECQFMAPKHIRKRSPWFTWRQWVCASSYSPWLFYATSTVPNYPEKAKSYPPVRVLDGRKSLASEGNHLCDLHQEPENHLTRNLVCSGVLTGVPTLFYVNSRGPLPPRGPPVKDFCVLGQIGIAC